MGRKVDLIGHKYAMLSVKGYSHRVAVTRRSYWVCLCDCGNETVVSGNALRRGNTKSCGCLRGWISDDRISKAALISLNERYYKMVARCENKSDAYWDCYGGRGIKVCSEWLGPNGRKTFIDWAVSNGFEPTLTLDRVDVDGNYGPSNCRFVNWQVQANNTRRNAYIDHNGKTMTQAEWARELSMSYTTFRSRRRYGWSMDRIASTPVAGKCQ